MEMPRPEAPTVDGHALRTFTRAEYDRMVELGVIGINIRQTLDDPNDVILNFRFEDLARFKTVITDPSTRALMEADGVISQADIVFCTDPVGRQGGTPGRAR